MAKPNEVAEHFGQWLTAPDGTAHYVLGGKCLCGAKVKEFGGPPERKRTPTQRLPGQFLTPLCPDCVDLNIARWCGREGQGVASGHEAQWWSWWHERRGTGTRK